MSNRHELPIDTTEVNSAIDAHLGGDSTGLVPTVFGKVTLASAAERTVFVTPRGNDNNDGRSLASAFATISAALAALGGNSGLIQLGIGNLSTSATHTIPSGTTIRGAGRQQGLSQINYTGTATLFQGTAGTRTYNFELQDVILNGPGTSTASVALDLVDMSTCRFTSFTILTFGTAVAHRSIISGGAVYNTFTDGFITSCGTGVAFTGTGSNGSRWWGVKFGNCTTAVSIQDSNQNCFLDCDFETNTTAITISAVTAGNSDHNSFPFCRFEGNTTAWNITTNLVRDTVIAWPAIFGALGNATDNGLRSRIFGSSTVTQPGSIRLIRNRTSATTAVLVSDDIVTFSVGSTPATATLPDPSTVPVGFRVTLKQLGSASLTVSSTVGNIDGSASVVLNQYQVVTLVANSTSWFTI